MIILDKLPVAGYGFKREGDCFTVEKRGRKVRNDSGNTKSCHCKCYSLLYLCEAVFSSLVSLRGVKRRSNLKGGLHARKAGRRIRNDGEYAGKLSLRAERSNLATIRG